MEDISKTIENAAKMAGDKGLIRFTRFLDPAQVVLAEHIAKEYGAQFMAWGGYPRAERVVGCFYPTGESVDFSRFPIACLRSAYPAKFCSLSHRDLLGAFMSLGLTRDCTGDMIIVGADVYVFAHEQIASFIAQGLTSAGRASLDFSILPEIPEMPEPKGQSFSSVVSSLRLDAVLAAAYRLSRSEAAELIRSGMVKVNHLVCERVDTVLAEDTMLSLRGKGRIRLVSIDGLTRKQRIGITLFRYE